MEIRNIAEFANALDVTVAEVDALVRTEPDYPVWRMLQQQLHALQDWSRTTANPGSEKLRAISIGLIAARELEPTDQAWLQDLIDRLHLLNHYWRHWPTGDMAIHGRSWKWPRKLAIAVVVGVLLAGGATVALLSALRTEPGPAVAFGKTMPIPGASATLTHSLEPYIVSLNPDPERERHLLQLKLTDPGHGRPDRFIPIAKHMRINGLEMNAKLLGDDGHRLWFFVDGIGAWDYLQDKLVDAGDLRRANPALGTFEMKDNRGDPLIDPAVARIRQPARELWSDDPRLFGFDGRLKVTTPDWAHVYEIDPETLRANAM